jgi:glucose/arabinose dehydrogenase
VLISISFILIFFHPNTLYVFGKGPIKLKDPNLKVDLVGEGLKSPTSMAFLAESDILVLEKNGIVKRIIGNSVLEQPVLNITSIVNNTRERGLLGIAISGNSPSSRDQPQHVDSNVYLYFTENIPNDIHNHCVMNNCTGAQVVNSLYVYDMKDVYLVNPRLLLSIPFTNSDIGLEHIGGKITLGPDQRIYITGGDGYPCKNIKDCKASINEGVLNSKTANRKGGGDVSGVGGILALSKDGQKDKTGSILGDDFPLNLYYAYGIRNSFGMDFDPLTGNLWDTENGPYFGDEINLVKPGFNSGWAKAQGVWPITDYYLLIIDLPFGHYFPKGNTPVDRHSLFDFNGNGKYSSPEFTWNKSAAPTALKFLNSNKLGEEYKDDMFVGTYNKGRIYHFKLNDDRTTLAIDGQLKSNVASNETQLADFIFAKGFSPITDLQISPDGYLYVLTYEGTLWKITRPSIR